MIVADANLLINYARATPLASTARLVKARDSDWVSPGLWQAEVLNGLLVMHRAGLLDIDRAVLAYRNAAEATVSALHEIRDDAILSAARDTGLSAYDAHYVCMAQALGVPLVTEDKRILRACPDVARSMREFLAPPKPPRAVREKRAAYAGRARRQ